MSSQNTTGHIPDYILDFLTGIHCKSDRSGGDERKKKIFDRAFYNAYGDMSTHTVYYQEDAKKYFKDDNAICRYNKMAIKEAIKEYIKEDFKELKKVEDFSTWHEALCNKIVEIKKEHQFTAKLISPEDQTNKDAVNRKKNRQLSEAYPEDYEYVLQIIEKHNLSIINMPINKILRHSDLANTVFSYGQVQKLVNMMLKYLYIYCYCEGIKDLEHLVKYFHCPIDRYVLKAVCSKENYEGTPWSQLDSTQYEACQKVISDYVKDKSQYTSAFEWELSEWPFR